MRSADDNEQICAPPTVEQMRPQTRHYVYADLIYDEFKQYYVTFDEFMKLVRKSTGCELFSRKWYMPGSQFWEAPYQLKDATALCNVAFRAERSLGTLAAILFHTNYSEWVYSYAYLYLAVMAHLSVLLQIQSSEGTSKANSSS